MLRVFIESNNQIIEEKINSVNIQKFDIKSLICDKEKLKRFQKYVKKCLLEGDKILIITFIDMYLYKQKKEFQNDNLKVVYTKLPNNSEHLILREILSYQNKSLDEIEEKIKELEKMMELFFSLVIGY